jgi:hypothetical protein
MLPWSILLVLAQPGLGREPRGHRPPSDADDGDRLEDLHHRAIACYERTIAALRVAFVGASCWAATVVAFNPSLGVHEMLDGDINTALIGNWRGLLRHKKIAGSGSVKPVYLLVS